jgi:hypothetical protein
MMKFLIPCSCIWIPLHHKYDSPLYDNIHEKEMHVKKTHETVYVSPPSGDQCESCMSDHSISGSDTIQDSSIYMKVINFKCNNKCPFFSKISKWFLWNIKFY